MPTASTTHRDDNAPAISPGLLVAALMASAAVAVSAFNLTGEVTLGIDLGTTYSVAAGKSHPLIHSFNSLIHHHHRSDYAAAFAPSGV